MPYEPIKISSLKHMITELREAIYKPIADLEVTAWVTPEPVPYEERMSGTPLSLTQGERWGDLWDCAWFRFQGTIPELEKEASTVLLLDVNGELCLVDREGTPIQGLTTVNSEFDFSLGLPGKRVVDTRSLDLCGGTFELWADGGNNDLFGRYRGGTLKEAVIATCREDIRSLYYDAEVLLETAEHLPEGSARRAKILQALYDASLLLTDMSEDKVGQAKELLQGPLSLQGGDPVLRVSAVGHAHIDLAWLWPIRETIRKGARTFSTVLHMMERYPDYIFGASQPQLYAWMKEHHPKLYARIKERIQEGRWEPQGAMWVESDTNVPGGEALVRQILYGKRYFMQEFGMEVKSLWMPDVFGYTASLPQILRKAGVDYMMTQKLSWSEYNRHPHHSFHWEGIDGSKVLTHMPPEDTYNSPAAPRSLAKAEKDYLDKNISEHCLLLFGIGDGGGGPGEEHLERLAREKNLLGLPPVKQEPSWRFFERLEKESSRFETWRGELYLEKHQGTLTSQGRNKWYNRKLEKALRELEFASVLAVSALGHSYPAKTLERIWKEVLLYQFHDILPGSSIKRVYDESLERYEQLLGETEHLIEETYRKLSAHIAREGQGEHGQPQTAVFNSLPWEREEWVQTSEGQWAKVRVPSMGYALLAEEAQAHDPSERFGTVHTSASERTLQNELVKIIFDEEGAIVSIRDLAEDRELIAPGLRGNELKVYHDRGDAWDFRHDYAVTGGTRLTLQHIREHREGPAAGLAFEFRIGESVLTQTVTLTEGSRRIDFRTKVDWKERGKMLRTSFPLDIRTDSVTCEIQFGSISRPTHRNTMWDFAKDEICAHQWIDMSEPDYGVALLNDSKYGHRALNGVLDLNLLRSSSYPDPEADLAEHTFTYSLYPHAGNHVEAGVYKKGWELNVPLRTMDCAKAGHPAEAQNPKTDAVLAPSFLQTGHPLVMVESVKQAEDSEDIILRLYETSGTRVQTVLRVAMALEEAWSADLLEREQARLDVEEDGEQGASFVHLTFKPFEIHTLRLKRKR
ncbi:alpha-mannosidase [Paenibacillus campinasensis]|uniref:Alpha-mannosidase n=2 Tax=Paenibacillus campinasensis TaxID=66347 RepID=A0A268EQ41_9BACL|nr:alpha-mannosidase [Paenibacillus campinasensis]